MRIIGIEYQIIIIQYLNVFMSTPSKTNETITFISSDRFQITVLLSFVEKYGESILEEDLWNLNTKYGVSNYLHNRLDAAIVDMKYGTKQYWLNGEQMTDKEFYDMQFFKSVDEILEI